MDWNPELFKMARLGDCRSADSCSWLPSHRLCDFTRGVCFKVKQSPVLFYGISDIDCLQHHYFLKRHNGIHPAL